jgi:hypothetical protein
MMVRWATVLFLLLSGYSIRFVRCDYVFILPQEGLSSIAEATTNGECRCESGKAPTEYLLSRDRYDVTFSIGDRWYPQLMLDLKDKSGQSLAIDSSHIRESHMPASSGPFRMVPTPITMRGRSYRYFARLNEVPNHVLIFRVLDATGAVIKAETIPIELRKGKHLSIDAI